VLVVLAAVGVGTLGDWGSALLGALAGSESHWSEWFDADLVWAPPAVALAATLDAVVMAPVLEEIVFRGLLFGALRMRLALPGAALASAVVFAGAHGYGMVGFASVLVSGVVWAYAYERTGSLVPAMAAHAVNNAAATLTVVLIYR
jgi:hypothetical protein